ncbi:conserved hypothetical protein [Desulfamplus magnetovallimortis]|uniref:PBP domain-containing protein n=1 Tax=Desulfamplus magnetovallimortis TaxID=1246637 RepID=A0A1W1H8M8_9BACT|nr:hypothetical protein [Desulfamplus magnetovallimortis]SLM28821.1 conserved hypothetical protein [Desulfamplus magnetovallimortis]
MKVLLIFHSRTSATPDYKNDLGIFTVKYIFLIICSYLCFTGTGISADISVIVHPDFPIQALSSREVSDIYLGRLRALPSGNNILILEHEQDSYLRENFFRLLNGMTLKRLNAYWARLQFSGAIQPPPILQNSKEVVAIIKNVPSAIGYVDTNIVDGSVRVILHLKDDAEKLE